MTITQTPLEKQIVNIDLSKGADERQRPELMGGLTRVDNLVQDQTGAWSKRPGCVLGPIGDGSGGLSGYPLYPKKILSFINGWGCIAEGGTLLHKQDYNATFRARQKAMDLAVVSAGFVTSSGPSAQNSVSGAGVHCYASNSAHDIVIFRQLSTAILAIRERSTGALATYDLSRVISSLTTGDFKCAVVGDRFLHVYSKGVSGNIQVVQVDLSAPLPATESALASGIVTVVGGNNVIYDAVAGAAYSYLLYYDVSISTSKVAQLDTLLTVTDSSHFVAGGQYYSMSLNGTTANLWLVTNSTTDCTVKAVSSTAVGTTTVAAFATGVPGNFIAVDATDAGVIVAVNSATFGGSTIDTIAVYTKSASNVISAVGGCYGWSPAATPYYLSAANKFLMHVVKFDPTSEISHHSVIDLSSFSPFATNGAALAMPYGTFRVACNLEPYLGLKRLLDPSANGVVYPRESPISDSAVVPMVCVQTAQRAAAFSFVRLQFNSSTAYGHANFAGSTYVAHGGLNQYDGNLFCDQGFGDMPVLNATPSAGVGGVLNGSYRYVAVYRHVDAVGAGAYSRTYGPVATVNVAGAVTGRNSVVIQPFGASNRITGAVPASFGIGVPTSMPFVEVYRTRSGGTQFYLCASSQFNIFGSTSPLAQQIAANATTGLLTFTDNLSDTNLVSQAVMYRQPGTTNAPADRYTAPPGNILCQHKDRLFCTDATGQRVYYSSFFVDGESAWFNPAFNFFVHDGDGPITGLASMDGRLFIFKQDAVFVVDGDGPGESGPTGNEFSPPQALASRYGCVDHRSIVRTPEGIVYRSRRGIEMIDRKLSVTWIGERVQETAAANPVTTGSCIDQYSRVHISLAESEPVGGLYYVPGCELVYDMTSDAWSVFRFTGWTGIYGHAKQSIAMVRNAGKDVIVRADGYYAALVDDPSIGNDLAYYTPSTVETGWIKQGPQSRQRCSDLLMLAKKRAGSNHRLRLSIAYDYSDTYTQTKTWTAAQLAALTLEELELQPQQQQVLAIRFKIEDLESDDLVTYPTGTGKGCDFLAISAEVAPKAGVPKLATGQKG